jgi:hypothetical protein
MVVNDTPAVTQKKPRAGTIFPFVTSAARAFGVDRVTLYRVLKGQLPDRRNLAARYAEFVKGGRS